tara:strand:- start:6857 stop:7153 length:297 start_codon:yes stop_codon:yes gene_type:complete
MALYLTAFSLSFFSIFMKGFASQNIIYKRKELMIPTSWVLSIAELFTAGIFVQHYLTSTVVESIILALVVGTGGGIGCMLSMDFHGWLTKKIYKWHED